jgi:hypothetical protein
MEIGSFEEFKESHRQELKKFLIEKKEKDRQAKFMDINLKMIRACESGDKEGHSLLVMKLKNLIEEGKNEKAMCL